MHPGANRRLKLMKMFLFSWNSCWAAIGFNWIVRTATCNGQADKSQHCSSGMKARHRQQAKSSEQLCLLYSWSTEGWELAIVFSYWACPGCHPSWLGQSAAHTGTEPSQNTEFKMDTHQRCSQACYTHFKQHRYWDSEDATVVCTKHKRTGWRHAGKKLRT